MQPSNFLLSQGSKGRFLDDMINGHRRVPEPLSPETQILSSSSQFPLGVALVVLIIVCGVSMSFLCCYHWKWIRSRTSRLFHNSLERPPAHTNQEITSEESSVENSLSFSNQCKNMKPVVTSLPVLMPGDVFPRYVAWPAVAAQGSPLTQGSHLTDELKIVVGTAK